MESEKSTIYLDQGRFEPLEPLQDPNKTEGVTSENIHLTLFLTATKLYLR
jgi:hypothetical protein